MWSRDLSAQSESDRYDKLWSRDLSAQSESDSYDNLWSRDLSVQSWSDCYPYYCDLGFSRSLRAVRSNHQGAI
ncbi:hypothetical protein F4694_003202 [Bacillus niacini]|uniref:Uncharacterized protein n=1 Tax=Neobacillus niacini TaxID=86668 RepID=A0A852TCB8_9BACI|nr:hypothetical protein [Neobacillus niacini]NYE06422.1 hypothetical protein [Neobacillus niacini]